jgi:hypothetical protein
MRHDGVQHCRRLGVLSAGSLAELRATGGAEALEQCDSQVREADHGRRRKMVLVENETARNPLMHYPGLNEPKERLPYSTN